jgi:Tfp pilus assembly protein PilZ
MKLRGKRVLISTPELKKSALELTSKDEDMIMRDAMKQWQKLEVFAVGDEVTNLNAGDSVYIQTYALESGERIEIEGNIKFLVPDTAVAIIW